LLIKSSVEKLQTVAPRAGFAGGIRFSLEFVKKQIPRCARDDKNGGFFLNL
jgi:hypothetical protein